MASSPTRASILRRARGASCPTIRCRPRSTGPWPGTELSSSCWRTRSRIRRERIHRSARPSIPPRDPGASCPPRELHEIDARYTIDAKLVGPGLTADETLTDAWPKLSHPPAGQEDFGNGPFATALFGEADAYFFDYGGWAFDAFGDGWLEVPLLDSEEIDLRSYVSAGNRLLAFNGIDWDGFDGTFLNETWMWSPPAASPG